MTAVDKPAETVVAPQQAVVPATPSPEQVAPAPAATLSAQPVTPPTAAPETINILTYVKLIFEHGFAHSKNKSRINLLLAVHNCHYAVEQVLREKARDMAFNAALRKIGFEEIIKVVNDKNNIPDYNHLLALNKIRNDVEHSNIIPDQDSVKFYVKITEDFLKWSFRQYFDVKYEDLALENMIHDSGIRECLKTAKQMVDANADLQETTKKILEALAAFKFLAFGYLSDSRVNGISFGGIDFPNLLADLGLKILLADDENALQRMMSIGSSFKVENGVVVGVQSVYGGPTSRNKDEAQALYDEIVSIILTHQDKLPKSIWRK